ncbi:hypothetical protein L7F22_063137 [Adiantum nelumboides]|nr:hypothetical protein [Adiantum nelumboides]
MCNSTEQVGVEQPSDSRKDNGFTLESDILFLCAITTNGNSNTKENINDTSVKKVSNFEQTSLVNDSSSHEVLGTLSQLSAEACAISFTDLRPYAIPPMENGKTDTLPIDKEVTSKLTSLEAEVDAMDGVKLKKEDMPETQGETLAESIVSLEISDGNIEKTSSKISVVPISILEPGGQELDLEEAEEAVNYTYREAKESDMLEGKQKPDDAEDYHSSIGEFETCPCTEHCVKKVSTWKDDLSSYSSTIAASVGEFETFPCTEDFEKNLSTLKDDVLLQEVTTENKKLLNHVTEYVACMDERQSKGQELRDDQPAMVSQKETFSDTEQISNTCEDTDNDMVSFITADLLVGIQQIESETVQSEQVTRETDVTEDIGKLLGSENLALEHGQEKLEETSQDSSIEIEHREANELRIVHAVDTKENNAPELAEFFSDERGSEHEVEIEEQDHGPIRIKSSSKRKIYNESPRSLRMLLFSDEIPSFAQKEERYKRDGNGMEFSNIVVPAFEGIVAESHIDDIKFQKRHETADNVEAWTDLSGPLALSGALTYQGLISYTGPVANSGSISNRSDSSTSTRSFAFPILASEWNASPVKMHAPDPRDSNVSSQDIYDTLLPLFIGGSTNVNSHEANVQSMGVSENVTDQLITDVNVHDVMRKGLKMSRLEVIKCFMLNVVFIVLNVFKVSSGVISVVHHEGIVVHHHKESLHQPLHFLLSSPLLSCSPLRFQQLDDLLLSSYVPLSSPPTSGSPPTSSPSRPQQTPLRFLLSSPLLLSSAFPAAGRRRRSPALLLRPALLCVSNHAVAVVESSADSPSLSPRPPPQAQQTAGLRVLLHLWPRPPARAQQTAVATIESSPSPAPGRSSCAVSRPLGSPTPCSPSRAHLRELVEPSTWSQPSALDSPLLRRLRCRQLHAIANTLQVNCNNINVF